MKNKLIMQNQTFLEEILSLLGKFRVLQVVCSLTSVLSIGYDCVSQCCNKQSLITGTNATLSEPVEDKRD